MCTSSIKVENSRDARESGDAAEVHSILSRDVSLSDVIFNEIVWLEVKRSSHQCNFPMFSRASSHSVSLSKLNICESDAKISRFLETMFPIINDNHRLAHSFINIDL